MEKAQFHLPFFFNSCDAIKYMHLVSLDAAVLILCVLILQTMFLIAFVGGNRLLLTRLTLFYYANSNNRGLQRK